MTTKRKAELQRRLSMASVPKPPAGLADRLKSDIPDLLGTTRERERLSSSVAFNLRVAASIILLVSSAYLCVQLLSRADRNEAAPPMAAMAPPGRLAFWVRRSGRSLRAITTAVRWGGREDTAVAATFIGGTLLPESKRTEEQWWAVPGKSAEQVGLPWLS